MHSEQQVPFFRTSRHPQQARPDTVAADALKQEHIRNAERIRRSDRHVAILMALYNGERCLPDQLYSFKTQTHEDWSLIVSDDGSNDNGAELVRCFARAERMRQVKLIDGPKQGFAVNFLHLLNQVDGRAAYAAFSDQDDAWLRDKIETALNRLAEVPDAVPAVYCGSTWICNARLRRLRRSTLFRYEPRFENAIVQSIGGGNTMVLNRAAIDLVQEASRDLPKVASHDWWVYQIVSGVAGVVIYDDEPMVLYRQHDSNLIGAGDSLAAVFRRLMMLIRGQFRDWNEANLAALNAIRHRFTPMNQEILEKFDAMRSGSLVQRFPAGIRSGIRHQTLLGNAGLILALLLKKL